MKSIIFSLILVEVVFGATISSYDNKDLRLQTTSPEGLFQTAWKYQDKFTRLQDDIHTQLFIVRTAVPNILKVSTNTTLGQLEGNAQHIFILDQVVRTKIMAKDRSPCLMELIEGLNSVTNMLGFASSNKLKDYDRAINEIVKCAYAELQNCQGLFAEVQQVVVRSFIGANVFTMQALIENKFRTLFERHEQDWNNVRPNISQLIVNLSNSIEQKNEEFGLKLTQLRISANESYNKIQDAMFVCDEFDGPYAIYNKKQRHFRIEDFLPKIE